jgi:hypothetical protein
MTDDSIGDELHKLSEEFRKLAGLPTSTEIPEKTPQEQLTKFGLTLDEAKAWLRKEPNYVPADEKKHLNRADEDVPVPQKG